VFFLAAASEHFFWFAALHVLVGALGCAAVFSPLLADVSRWFLRRRGFAIAVCASGNYVAGTLWPPVVDAIISAEGWRQAYVTLGFVSAVVMLPLILLLRRPPPMSDGPVVAGGSSGTPQTLGLTANQLTWLLGVAGVGCCVAMAMPQAHVVALSMDLGFSASHGAQMLSLMFGCGVVSRLVFGWLSDRLGGLRTLLIGSSLQCLALLMFLPAASLQTLYLVAALFGLFQGGIVPCYALIVREYFPEREAGTRTGLIVFATLVGMAFGGSASGWIFDLSGSYDAAFLHGVGWNLLNIVIIGLLVARSRQSGIAPRPSLQSNASL
jgi:MFS family permease